MEINGNKLPGSDEVKKLTEKARRLLSLKEDSITDEDARAVIEDMLLADRDLSWMTLQGLSSLAERIFLSVR